MILCLQMFWNVRFPSEVRFTINYPLTSCDPDPGILASSDDDNVDLHCRCRQHRIFCSSTVSFHVKTGGQAGRLPGTVFIINTILHRPGVCAGPHPAHNPGKQGLLKEFFIWKGLPWWPEIRETQQNNCCTCSIQQWSIRIVHSILEKRFSLCVLWVVRVSTW